MLLDSIPLPSSLSPPTTSLLNDIFSTSRSPSPTSPSSPSFHNPSPNISSNLHHQHNHNIASEPSDIPRLRSQHVTSGYRDGIASSREAALQGGFDEGYTLGAVMGLRVGWLIGVLEGVDVALRAEKGREKGGDRGTTATAIGEGSEEKDAKADLEMENQQHQPSTNKVTEEISTLLKRAREELHLTRLFSPEYWDANGVWKYKVKSEKKEDGERRERNKLGKMDVDVDVNEEEEVTFEEVADQHPLVKAWRGEVERLMRQAGIRAKVWDGEEWERGRVS